MGSPIRCPQRFDTRLRLPVGYATLSESPAQVAGHHGASSPVLYRKRMQPTNRSQAHDQVRIDVHLNGQGLLETMAEEVRQGLANKPKYLFPKFFYDDLGSDLFEQITETPEYYPARAERALLASMADELMADLRPHELVELGSGSSSKTQLLLNSPSCFEHLRVYVPFDVSEGMLRGTAGELVAKYPFLRIHGVVGDFERHLEHIPSSGGRRLVLFLGSTLGNLEPSRRRQFLTAVRALLGPDDRFLIGLDLVKDPAILHEAYNDSAGVTAAFNRNILRVVNNALNADFDLNAFEHLAFYNADAARIEMHLVAQGAQQVHLNGLALTIELVKGERIWTENSYKFTEESASGMLTEAGMRLDHWYEATGQLFGLALARAL
jgi:L-histidine N-alpha-methyltransferase